MNETETTVAGSLVQLGNTADEVARTLLRGNHKGNHTNCLCPVAIYLSRKFPHLIFDVARCYTTFVEAETGEQFKVENPLAVRHFVARFDYGSYPLCMEEFCSFHEFPPLD